MLWDEMRSVPELYPNGVPNCCVLSWRSSLPAACSPMTQLLRARLLRALVVAASRCLLAGEVLPGCCMLARRQPPRCFLAGDGLLGCCVLAQRQPPRGLLAGDGLPR